MCLPYGQGEPEYVLSAGDSPFSWCGSDIDFHSCVQSRAPFNRGHQRCEGGGLRGGSCPPGHPHVGVLVAAIWSGTAALIPHHVTETGGIVHQSKCVVAAASLMILLGACGGSTSQQSGSSSRLSAKRVNWTGDIRAREARTGAAAPSKPPAMYQGSVRLTRADGDISRTNIYILLSGPAPDNNESMSWVLASGRCGAIEAPVLPVSAFDPLDIGSNGRAEKSTTVPFEFPTDGMYHVDFFSGHSARLTNVVACADLKLKE